MAMYKARGDSHNVIYNYFPPEGKKQMWETYATQLEAFQRKAYIDYLQKIKSNDEITKTAMEYKAKHTDTKALRDKIFCNAECVVPVKSECVAVPAVEENTQKTYREFTDKWLPYHARKNRLSPNTYDCYLGNLRRNFQLLAG